MPVFVIDQNATLGDVLMAETLKGMVFLICEQVKSSSSKDCTEEEIKSLMLQEISNQVKDMEESVTVDLPKDFKHKNFVMNWCDDCKVFHPFPVAVIEITPSKPEDEWTPII